MNELIKSNGSSYYKTSEIKLYYGELFKVNMGVKRNP